MTLWRATAPVDVQEDVQQGAARQYGRSTRARNDGIGSASRIVNCSCRVMEVQGHVELADSPIYQEARRRGKKVSRDMHKPPQGGDKCEGGVARGMISACKTEEEEDSDMEMDIEKQEG
eukprot:6208267-Pleurochrysis_carterae.AAC.2